MRKILLLKLALVFSCLTTSISRADESDKKSSDSIFSFDIYSLSKKKENAFDAASATYVLGSEDIRRSGATSIPEALRMVPGVQVARIDGNKWAITIRGFDNQFSNKLLVMIDGRTVYTPLFSGVFWDIHDYVIEDIDKIEVVRGPGGSIWGANAVNGVINIITKSAVQTQGVYVSQVVGNEDKSISEVRYGGSISSKDFYRVYAKKTVKDGLDKFDNGKNNYDGIRQDRAGFKYDILSAKDSTIKIQGDVFDGVAEDYTSVLNSSRKNDKHSKGANVIINWDKTLSARSNFTLQTYFDYDQFSLPALERSAKTLDVDFQHFYNFSRQNQFIWGLGYRQIIDDINVGEVSGIDIITGDPIKFVPITYSPDKRNDEIYSAFVQDKIGLIADELYLTLGSKFLINDFTGFEYQPNARLAYYPARNQTLWASISRAVRTPTRGEDGFNAKDSTYGITNSLGSNTYESERVVAYEVGYRIKPTIKTLFDATAFFNDYSKLTTFESGATDPYVGTGFPTASNLGYGESYGVELSGKWQVNDIWRLEASYDYLTMNLHVSDASTDRTSSAGPYGALEISEGMSPKNQFRLRSFLNLTSQVEFDNMLYYVDSLPGAKPIISDEDGIPSYFRFDTRLGYLPTKNLDLSFGIRNLFDDRHSEFSAGLYATRVDVSRTFYIKAVWQY